ncbi:uncharacterized protein LACBIDRAFT_325988 [Laccaria bicolor S238N-H82]|uniref:Predicted protein n=1 Tax=Laccaria bicolor (strain S238N-H82 / ATCC MYA-4686) TaxID=486041 RepID=B0D6X1_LACBS|nr:uncharacterized protein LACBIDRAFT_325988 [Laccaria bicolor S238N-H82]EDR09551.1 predicted protein [Laccaria bicolor S238N-H82]|eukprot:XP_001879900.1 predicted protein [Laccaria bicolor S238N-H82]
MSHFLPNFISFGCKSEKYLSEGMTAMLGECCYHIVYSIMPVHVYLQCPVYIIHYNCCSENLSFLSIWYKLPASVKNITIFCGLADIIGVDFFYKPRMDRIQLKHPVPWVSWEDAKEDCGGLSPKWSAGEEGGSLIELRGGYICTPFSSKQASSVPATIWHGWSFTLAVVILFSMVQHNWDLAEMGWAVFSLECATVNTGVRIGVGVAYRWCKTAAVCMGS